MLHDTAPNRPDPTMAVTAEVPPVMTTDEVADLLRVDPETVRIWLRRGLLNGTKVGQNWKIHRGAVMTEDGRVRDDIGPNYE
jgi:excisionase family DNA binding protein